MGSVKKVRSEQKEATREQLLAAATELLRHDGYAALRVAAVAKQAHVSLGGMLHHFPSKESLVIAVLDRVSAHVLALAKQDADRDSSGTDILQHIAESARRFYNAPEFLIYLDIFLSVRRGTPIGEAATTLLLAQRGATEELWLPHLTERGIATDEARSVIRALWALARGLAISSLPRDASSAEGDALNLIVATLRERYAGLTGGR